MFNMGLGFGDWGLGFETAALRHHPNPKHLIPNPHTRTFGFLCSHRSSGFVSHEPLPHHVHSASPELNVAGTFNLPTGDAGILTRFQTGRILGSTFVDFTGLEGRKVLRSGGENSPNFLSFTTRTRSRSADVLVRMSLSAGASVDERSNGRKDADEDVRGPIPRSCPSSL